MKQYSIGVDFGTLSGRAVLVDTAKGTILSSSVWEYPHGVMERTLPCGKPLPDAWSLHHPADYLDVLAHTVPQVIRDAGVSAEDVVGIGIDCTASTVLPVTRDGTPLCFLPEFEEEPHAYIHLWKHHAAQPYADRMTRKAEERGEAWLAAYGGKVSCEGALPKLWQMLEEAPRVCEGAAYWMEAADWLVWQLCGKPMMSTCCAGYKYLYCDGAFPSEEYFSGLNSHLAQMIRDKCGLPIQPVFSKAGTVTAAMSRRLGLSRDTAVAVGMIDAHACVPSAGVTKPGEMVMILGTSACLMVCGDTCHPVPGCYAVRDGILPGSWGYEGGQNSVGDLFAWMLRTCVPESVQLKARENDLSLHDYLSGLAAQKRPGESGLLALDWLNGNRSVLMDSELSGMILGLTLQTAPEDVYRALAEAAAYGARMIIGTFREHGVHVDKLLVTGGISQKNPMMMQIYADVLQMPVQVLPSSHGSALGSAIAAAVAAGCYDTVEHAIEHMSVKPNRVYRPIAENIAVYNQLYLLYEKLYRLYATDGTMKELLAIKRGAALLSECQPVGDCKY